MDIRVTLARPTTLYDWFAAATYRATATNNTSVTASAATATTIYYGYLLPESLRTQTVHLFLLLPPWLHMNTASATAALEASQDSEEDLVAGIAANVVFFSAENCYCDRYYHLPPQCTRATSPCLA